MSVDASVALITLAQAKTHLKISGSTEDTLLEEMINRSGQVCASYAGRNFKSAQRTEYYDGNGKSKIELMNFPVTAITSVNIDPLRLWSSSTALDVSTDLILDGQAGILQISNGRFIFTKGLGNIRVIYTAGYKDSVDNLVPWDLQEASLIILQLSYKRHYQDQRIGLTSETVGDRTYNYSNEDIPAKARMILDSYRELAKPELIAQFGSITVTEPTEEDYITYYGDPDTEGTYRTRTDGVNLVTERLESGVWVQKGYVEP